MSQTSAQAARSIDPRLRMVRARLLTKSSDERWMAMKNSLEYIENAHVSGDVVECGVWRGGNIALARLMAPGRRCWLYDTFEGMTPPCAKDGEKANIIFERKGGRPMTRAPLDLVREDFTALGVLDEKLTRFVVGDVRETLLAPDNLPEKISLLRLDTDWYESTKMELEVLYPRLAEGGILIVDDYGHWMGARLATDEYLRKWDPRAMLHLKHVDYTAVMLRKR